MKAAACAKHFAVHSGPEAIRHEFDAIATPKDMEETYLPAFEALTREADVEGFMGAYNRTNGEPAAEVLPFRKYFAATGASKDISFPTAGPSRISTSIIW